MNTPINITTILKGRPAALLETPLATCEPVQIAAQWLVANALTKALVELVTQPSPSMGSISSSSLSFSSSLWSSVATPRSDKWGFGMAWYEIAEDFPTVESLYAAILDRRRQIHELKEYWRPYVKAIEEWDQVHVGLSGICMERNREGAYRFPVERMVGNEDGASGSYFALDEEGKRRFVIKPIDEDIGALNNGKGLASPYADSFARDHTPLYLSPMRETMAYEAAKLIGVETIVPKTTLAIVESDAFYDQLDGIDPSERTRYERSAASVPIREKLCSAQEFVPNSKMLFEGLQDLQQAGLSDEEIAERFDTQDFEEANILLWCTYDTDGHMGNFLVYPKSHDAIGNEILGIRKIDNGLAFPEKNEQLRNNLVYMPNAEKPLSEEARAKIALIPVEALADELEQFGLEGSVEAMRERIGALKEIVAQNPNLSIREIDERMESLSYRVSA